MPELSWERLVALLAFAGTYLGLALGRLPGFRVDRTGVAIIGATVMVVSGVLPWEKAVAAVDAHTLVLLFGMMIVAAYLRLSGFFHLVTHWAVRRARSPMELLAAVALASGVLSALFVNDVICLVLAPVVLAVVRQLRLPPVPYLLALATAANVGSVGTLTGNPQNMLIGGFSRISYRTFLAHEGPVALIGLACVIGVLWLAYRRQLAVPLPPVNLAANFPVHAALMTKTIVAVCVMLVAFFAGVPIALVAVGGAAVCLLTRRVKPEKVYREIDWHLLVLFTGLFVVIGGVEEARLTAPLFDLAGRLALYRPAVLTVTAAVLSNLVSNVPAVLLFKTVVPSFGEPARAWLILAMASTLAGNLTILGSVANLIVVEAAREERVPIGFWEYARIGVPITLVTLVFGWAALVLLPA
ncbi:MAG TPA: anion transporter [Methylomirabilota bacterium]